MSEIEGSSLRPTFGMRGATGVLLKRSCSFHVTNALQISEDMRARPVDDVREGVARWNKTFAQSPPRTTLLSSIAK